MVHECYWSFNNLSQFMRSLRILALLFFVSLVAARPVQAQTQTPAVAFDAMQIDIWPEYDRPDVLVIYRITLSSQLSLPTQVSVEIPRTVELNSLAWQDVDGSLYVLPYSSEVLGDWLKITFNAPSAKIQVEYYDTRITREQDTRTFNFSWICGTDINDLVVSIQQPVNATNMQVTPDFGTGQTQPDGLVYFTRDVGKVSNGTTLQVDFQYQKSDEALSINQQSVQASAPISKTDYSQYLPWALGALAGILIIGGLVWFFGYQNKIQTRQKGRRRHASTPLRKEDANNSTQAVVHCHRCGRKASPGDLYCRTCGTRLPI